MIRFYNGRTLEPCGVTENEIWVDGAAISYVGPGREDMPAFDRQIDLGGDLVMPGFKDAHTHSGMTFLRSAADDLPLHEWLEKQVFPREAKLTPESTGAFVKLAFLEYLANGITACFDMYYHTDEFARIARDWGFRAVLCGSFTVGNDWSELYDFYDRYNHGFGPLVSAQLGFHAEYTANREKLEYLSKVCHELKAPVWCHNSETASEVRDCVARHGMTPTKLFDTLGLYDYGGGGYHCIYLNDEDMDIFARRGLWAVLNACSNGKLASGTFHLHEAMEKGVKLAVGTDGPASNNALDMFREMYLINIMAKLRQEDAAAGDPALILDAAVSGGARAMGLDSCDAIAPGKQADLVRIDMQRPNMRPVHNVVKNLVYSGNPGNVRMTMIAGRVLYEDGQFFVGEDAQSVYRDAERYTRQIVTG